MHFRIVPWRKVPRKNSPSGLTSQAAMPSLKCLSIAETKLICGLTDCNESEKCFRKFSCSSSINHLSIPRWTTAQGFLISSKRGCSETFWALPLRKGDSSDNLELTIIWHPRKDTKKSYFSSRKLSRQEGSVWMANQGSSRVRNRESFLTPFKLLFGVPSSF